MVARRPDRRKSDASGGLLRASAHCERTCRRLTSSNPRKAPLGAPHHSGANLKNGSHGRSHVFQVVDPPRPLLEGVDAVPRGWANSVEGVWAVPTRQHRSRRQSILFGFGSCRDRCRGRCSVKPELDELERLDTVLENMRWRAGLPDTTLPTKASTASTRAQQQEGWPLSWSCPALPNLRR